MLEVVNDTLERTAVASRAEVTVVRRSDERWLSRLCNTGQALADGMNGAGGALIVCVLLWGRRHGLAENGGGGGGKEEGPEDHAMAAKRRHEEARYRFVSRVRSEHHIPLTAT